MLILQAGPLKHYGSSSIDSQTEIRFQPSRLFKISPVNPQLKWVILFFFFLLSFFNKKGLPQNFASCSNALHVKRRPITFLAQKVWSLSRSDLKHVAWKLLLGTPVPYLVVSHQHPYPKWSHHMNSLIVKIRHVFERGPS